MKGRYLVTGALAAGLALFIWQFLSHALIPWHDGTFREFTDAAAVTDVLSANAPQHGVYMATSGIVAAVRIDPAIPDRSLDMGGTLARQAGINVVFAFLLAVLIMSARRRRALDVAARMALLGLAAGLIVHISQWNWLGFGPSFAIVNTVDLAVGWWISGLILGALANRMLREQPMIGDTMTHPRPTASVG